MNQYTGTSERQEGAVLFIALIMLLVLTVISVTAMQTTTLEERMAGNLRDQTLAFQASEAGLREGESWLSALSTEPIPQASCTSSCGTTVYQLNAYDLLGSAVWTGNSVRAYAGGTLKKVATLPKYLVEFHSFIPDSLTTGKQSDNSGRVTFRATSRGTGGSDDAKALNQSTYTRRF